MTDMIEYMVRDRSDWQGTAFIYPTFQAAFEAWSADQDCEVIELCIAEGTARDITEDMGSLYASEMRHARQLRRHQASYAGAM